MKLDERRVSARRGGRVRMSGHFQYPQKWHGRPCTMVGGRPWSALRTPELQWSCCGPNDPRETRSCEFPVVGDVVNPGYPCSSRCGGYSSIPGCYPVGLWCHHGTASRDPVSTTDEKPALATAGLTGQVESRRPYPPSSLREVIGRPGWQPRGLSDLSYFYRTIGAAGSSYAH